MMRNLRLYFIIGSMALLFEFILVLWSYGIVEDLNSSQDQQYPMTFGNNKNRKNRENDRSPDGSFNGYPVYYHDLNLDKTYHSRPYSSVRCVGENYQGDDFAWMHRSCHFRFLCFNVSSREFEVYARPDDETLGLIASQRRFMDLSSGVVPLPRNQESARNRNKTGNGISLGSGTVRHSRYYFDDTDSDRDRLHHLQGNNNWFPTVVRSSPPEQYYALEEGVVFVPFHSEFSDNIENEGKEYSAVWDDLFPIYTLLNMFQLVSPENEALLMRYLPLWASNSNSVEDETKNHSNDNHNYLLRKMDLLRPLMMKSHREHKGETKWTSQIDAALMSFVTATLRSSTEDKMLPLNSGLVCARDGVAGLGPHGIRYMKGRNQRDVFHNQGKGGILWMFRNYCVDNLGLSTSTSSETSTIRIVVSVAPFPNGDDTRADSFSSIGTEIREFLSSTMKNHNEGVNDGESVTEIESDIIDVLARVKLMTDTSLFIATCSAATASAALFLPRGASLIVFYSTDAAEQEVDSKTAVRKLKSVCHGYEDLLNNFSHVHVHWLPISTLDNNGYRDTLFRIVEKAARIK